MNIPPYTPPCSQCGGAVAVLGELAHRVLGRCRACGFIQGTDICAECMGYGDIPSDDDPEFDSDVHSEICPVCDGSGIDPARAAAQ